MGDVLSGEPQTPRQILCLHPVTVGQKVPILDFQSEFSMSQIVRIFLNFFFIEAGNLNILPVRWRHP